MSEAASRISRAAPHRVQPPSGSPASDVRGPSARRFTRPPAVVYQGSGERSEVALSFDDGPSRWTAPIAATLEAHGCHGTFFIRGAAVEEHRKAVAALATAGHELGNHLWSHSDPREQSTDEIRAEIERTGEAIRLAGGTKPTLVRPPYCQAPDRVAEAARGAGVAIIVQRSFASADWSATSAEEIVEPLLGGLVPGDIVCLHDGISPDDRDTACRDATVAAVAQLVPALLERDLRPVTVSRLLE